MVADQQLRVNIIGAGLSGGALANALLDDSENRFKVQVFERDDLAFSSERGGYQIRLGEDGVTGLRQCLDSTTYEELRSVWGTEEARAPAVIDPISGHIAAQLKDLKLYPKSRAVPRSALKDVLLRKPLKQDCVKLGRRLVDIKTDLSVQTGQTEITCIFEDGSQDVCDLLIAADGSRSIVNRLMGINNAIPVPLSAVQGRGPISRETHDRLPSQLLENGSLLAFGGDVASFSAVYETTPTNIAKSNVKANDSFLFWTLKVSPECFEAVSKMENDADRHKATMDYLHSSPACPQLLPEIIKHGTSNIKLATSTTSKPPGDWRAGKDALGRIILIGDAIHPMTAGRGQGANQALRDAGVLQSLLKARLPSSGNASDVEIMAIASDFDVEMYKRAFAWVDSSETATKLNLQYWTHYIGFKALIAALHIAGAGVSLLELLHLRKRDIVNF